MGNPVLEPIYKKYLMDQDNDEYCSVWVAILADLGVKDKRIYELVNIMGENPKGLSDNSPNTNLGGKE